MPPKASHALGKRKRITREELQQQSRSPSPSSSQASDASDDAEDMQALFRKAFEAKFAPLDIEPVNAKKQKQTEEEQIDEDDAAADSDWSGISEDDEEDATPKVQIIDASASTAYEKPSKATLRAFMSHKPPTSTDAKPGSAQPKPKKVKDDADPTEAAHLKNDLELQNLLRESTLLSTNAPTYSTRTGSTRQSASTATRLKLADLHMQALGARDSVFAQKSMPMSHRKGISEKKRRGEEKRRSEAKENGIILEKERRVGKPAAGSSGKRDRGVGAPSVGRFKGGTLTLSKSDIRGLTTRDEKGKGKGRGRGRR